MSSKLTGSSKSTVIKNYITPNLDKKSSKMIESWDSNYRLEIANGQTN